MTVPSNPAPTPVATRPVAAHAGAPVITPLPVAASGPPGVPQPQPRPVPSAPVPRVTGGEASDAGLTMARLDQITDYYLWDSDIADDFAMAMAFAGHDYALQVHGSEVEDFVRSLRDYIRTDKTLNDVRHLNDFQINFAYGGRDFVFRAHRDRTIYMPQLCLRRVSTEVPVLSKLSLPPMWGEILLSKSLGVEGGLVILAAKPGSGKSTTIAGMIRERLELYGGVARTIEAPVEYPLQNSWGRGVCFQIPVDESLPRAEQFLLPLRAQMRAYPTGVPSILMVGEIRDQETAAEVINASVGHLVITTMHAIDIETTVRRLCGWAGQVFGPDVAREMVGGAIRIIANQRLERVNGTRVARGELLFSRGAYSEVASMIRDGRFEQLTGVINTQQRQIGKAANERKGVEALLDELSRNEKRDAAENVK